MNSPSPVLHRVRVAENRDESRLVPELAGVTGQPEPEIEGLLLRAGRRLTELLGHEQLPLRISSAGSVRIEGVAGLLRLSPQLELEIVPKFLEGTDADWRQDFFRVALLSKTGKLLPREHLRADFATRGDLTTLVGRTLAYLYWESHRRPLREYRSRTVRDYAVVGDLDPVGIVLPEAGGFKQEQLVFDHVNSWNEVISAAASALLPEVQDGETLRQLLRVRQALAPQREVRSALHRRLPNRYHHWQALYDLSVEVLNGFGVGYDERHLRAPGYVMVMWSTWQHLCELALRVGLTPLEVHASPPFPLGMRNSKVLTVTPDVAVGPRNAPTLLVDAKYRARLNGRVSVGNSDIYESLAFLRATGAEQMILLYPRPASDGAPLKPGATRLFQTITVGGERIDALLVECRGIGAAQGFEAFSRNLASGIENVQLSSDS
ncbi:MULTISPECIES: 5-methylcytosine restriction system specificity protein McrC [Streptomyces]|uniref:5-methylcytosine restriction system specificity protein McrC n=1 Tax=Streptomyces TaxID=1883 RepID=UPI00345FD282